MSPRRILTLIVLSLWVTLGPVAMAFGGCLLMGALCDGPCGTSSDMSFTPVPAIGPEPLAYLEAQPRAHLPQNTIAPTELPPKQSPRPA